LACGAGVSRSPSSRAPRGRARRLVPLIREVPQAAGAGKEISQIHPIHPFATLVFRLVERQRHGPYRQRSSLLLYGQRARRVDRHYGRWNDPRGECGSQSSACCGPCGRGMGAQYEINAGELRVERLCLCIHEGDHHGLRFALFRPRTFGIERFVVHISCREWDAASAW
jgi:hypothetical protein